jgi:hypothetical protein
MKWTGISDRWHALGMRCRKIWLRCTGKWAAPGEDLQGTIQTLRWSNEKLRAEVREHVQFEDELVARAIAAEARLVDAALAKTEPELPRLSPAELERVAILADQCGQVVQICGKILRHGYESCNPFDARCKPNRLLLEREVGAVRGAIDLLINRGDIDRKEIAVWRRRKRSSLAQWTHHQGLGVGVDWAQERDKTVVGPRPAVTD